MTISEQLRQSIRAAADNRCGYCRVSSRFIYVPMEIDHLLPLAEGGTDDEENL